MPESLSPALSTLCARVKELERRFESFEQAFESLVDERRRQIEELNHQRSKMQSSIVNLTAYMSEICTACELMCGHKYKCPLVIATDKDTKGGK
jgi:hypothetical protein